MGIFKFFTGLSNKEAKSSGNRSSSFTHDGLTDFIRGGG